RRESHNGRYQGGRYHYRRQGGLRATHQRNREGQSIDQDLRRSGEDAFRRLRGSYQDRRDGARRLRGGDQRRPLRELRQRRRRRRRSNRQYVDRTRHYDDAISRANGGGGGRERQSRDVARRLREADAEHRRGGVGQQGVARVVQGIEHLLPRRPRQYPADERSHERVR